jgi:outer membrane protein OmpA-like peptidoglycan-associated protein
LLRIKCSVVIMVAAVLLLSLSLAAVATPVPVISGIEPAQGFDNQQIAFTISGAKFYSSKTTVKLVKAGQPEIVATDVIVSKSKDTITGTLNLQGQATGTWDLMVTNYAKILKKIKPTVLAGAFTIISAAPKIDALTPTNAFNDAAFTMIVTGTNFRNGAEVSLKRGDQVLTFANNDITKEGQQINAKINLSDATPGLYDVEVKNSDGSVAVLKQAFTVILAPTPVPVETPKPVEEVKPLETVKPIDPNSLFKSVFFDFNQSVIRNDQAAPLKANLQLIKKAKDGYIILGGHADERGPNDYNLKLSARRAETIKHYLVLSGIPARRIITYAYGETSPKSLGHNEKSWQFNRRVDIAIWNQVPSPKDALKK